MEMLKLNVIIAVKSAVWIPRKWTHQHKKTSRMTFIYYVQTFTVGRISRPSIIFSCKGVGRSLSLLCQGLRSEKCAGQVFDSKQITYCDNCERRKQSDLQIPLRNVLVKTNVGTCLHTSIYKIQIYIWSRIETNLKWTIC